MYRAITKNTCESTCGKSSMSHVEHAKQIITGMTNFSNSEEVELYGHSSSILSYDLVSSNGKGIFFFVLLL